MPESKGAFSHDEVFGGQVQLLQRRQGYRFSVDSLWLVWTARHLARGLVVDLGAGCGVIGLSLARLDPVQQVLLVERQPGLAQLARQNIARNALNIPAQVLQKDLRALQLGELPGPAQLVVFNPPFFDPRSSRSSRNAEQDAARRSLAGAVEDFIATAARILDSAGHCALVFLAQHEARLHQALQRYGLHLQARRQVFVRPDAAQARLIILLAGPQAQAARTLPACYDFDQDGAESLQARALRQSWPLHEKFGLNFLGKC